jgi:hypothetical protein
MFCYVAKFRRDTPHLLRFKQDIYIRNIEQLEIKYENSVRKLHVKQRVKWDIVAVESKTYHFFVRTRNLHCNIL